MPRVQVTLLALLLAAPLAGGLRPPVRGRSPAEAAQAEEPLPSAWHEPSAGGLLAGDGHAAAAGPWYAFPQTLGGAGRFRLWLWRVGIERQTLWWIIVVESLIILFTTGIPFIIWLCTRILGNTIEAGIETFDKAILGVDVEIDRITPNLIYGILDIEHLEVKNPENKGYTSPYLLKANRILVDIDMLQLFTSRFKHVKVEKLIFQNVDVIFEKTWKGSNVQDIIAFLNKEKPPEEVKAEEVKVTKDDSCIADKSDGKEPKRSRAQSEPPAPRKGACSCGQRAERKKSDMEEKPKPEKEEPEKKEEVVVAKKEEPAGPPPDLQVTLHEVVIEDVGARAQAQMLGGRGFRLSIADIRFFDFDKEMGASVLDDIVVILLKTVLKTVLTNIVGKRLGDHMM